MFDRLRRKSNQDLLDCKYRVQKLSEELDSYRKAERLNRMVIDTLQETVDINSDTIQLLQTTIESSKLTLKSVLGISTSDHGLEALTDMTATYILALEAGRLNGN